MTSTLLKFARLNAPKLHQLPNGLTIVAEQMPVEAVNLSLWVNAGSVVEADAINGMAHFLEHMVFKGTERLKNGEFEYLVEQRGAVTNAATSQDYTHYYITTAPEDFAVLAPLQIDVVLNATIPEDAFERERFVILEEIRRSEDNPRQRTFSRAMEIAFLQHPYRRPVLGSNEVISQLQPQQMRDFHARWYQPQFLTAVAVGNLPTEQLIEIIAEGFARSIARQPTKTNNQHLTFAPEPPFTSILRQEFTDATLQQARLVMVWRVPGLVELEKTYALDVLAAILGHGRTSRLVRSLREEKRLVSHISVSNITYKQQGIFYICAHCAVENVTATEEAIAQQIRRLQTELVQDAEIARVHKRVANRFIFGNETPSERAGLYGYYQTLIGNLEPAFDYPNHIQAQNAAHLMVAAQKYLQSDAYGAIVLKPY
jgi:predicted Zn-dependent peptidase